MQKLRFVVLCVFMLSSLLMLNAQDTSDGVAVTDKETQPV